MNKDYDITLESDNFSPLRDLVFKSLRKAIIQGKLEPGRRLMENTVAKKLGVSRTPVREAIRMLELEGLVTMEPRCGAMVSSITRKEMKDVLELRCNLDAFSVKLAMERMKPDFISKLKDANRKLSNAITTGDVVAIADADVAFHEIIYDATENSRLEQTLNALNEHTYRYRLEYLKNDQNHPLIVSEHDQIISLMSASKVREAQDAMIKHIQNQEIYIDAIAKKD